MAWAAKEVLSLEPPGAKRGRLSDQVMPGGSGGTNVRKGKGKCRGSRQPCSATTSLEDRVNVLEKTALYLGDRQLHLERVQKWAYAYGHKEDNCIMAISMKSGHDYYEMVQKNKELDEGKRKSAAEVGPESAHKFLYILLLIHEKGLDDKDVPKKHEALQLCDIMLQEAEQSVQAAASGAGLLIMEKAYKDTKKSRSASINLNNAKKHV